MYIYKSGVLAFDNATGGLTSGANVIILAPAMSEAEKIAYNLCRPLPGEYTIVLTTEDQSSELIDNFNKWGFNIENVGLIDTVTKVSTPTIQDELRVRYVGSPSDLTGIGIKFSKMVESITDGHFSKEKPARYPPPLRLCVSTVSTLLMYRKLEVLYQFLHVFSTKLKKMEGIGVYILNSESFDEKTISLLKNLMTVAIDIKVENDRYYLKLNGKNIKSLPWTEYRFEDGKMVVHI